ncbi:hypothetical protein LZT28_20845 [Aeromonas media]|uniref:Uncharacterized protein n=1 Tax=Aeromonas media TaxID=651 RepID=A0AAW5RT92_AERME|nr:hypothetical protein [Aeromonas media]MCV3290642.1 hypothetical protein [Aeromonas media]
MAYWPDTGTGVDTQPARKPVQSAIRKYFTEGGIGQAPTVPGGDWFNQMTNEVLNVLEAAGIEPSKTDDDQLLQAILHVSNAIVAREALRRSLAEAGYDVVGTFQAGFTFVKPNDVGIDDATSKAFTGPAGYVAPGTDPETGGFVDVSGALFRQYLGMAAGGGVASLVGATDINSVISALPASGGLVFCPPGNYSIADVPLNTNLTILGYGDSTVFTVPEGHQGFTATGSSAENSGNIQGLRLRGFKIVGAGTFDEHKHLIDLNGVTDYRVEGVTAENPQGDHIYIGSGRTGGMERHNYKGTITGSKFRSNGVGNRNAISVIDADGLDIFDNDFEGCSRPTMPGDIDLEPSNSFSVLKRINIFNNRSKDCRGSTAIVCVFVNTPVGFNQANYANINVYDNEFKSPINPSCTDFYVDFSQDSWIDDDTLPVITYINNESQGASVPFIIRSAPHIRFGKNNYRGFAQAALIGQTRGKDAIHLMEMFDEDADDALNVTYAFRFGSFKTLRIRRSRFGELGDGSTNASPIAFVGGASDEVDISDNDFDAITSATQKLIYASGHTFNPSRNTTRDNRFKSVKPFGLPAYNNNGLQEFNNGYTALVAPSLLPLGETISNINSASSGLPAGYAQGIVRTSKIVGTNGFCYQEFLPRDDGGLSKKTERIFRSASLSGDSWNGWYLLTGSLIS